MKAEGGRGKDPFAGMSDLQIAEHFLELNLAAAKTPEQRLKASRALINLASYEESLLDPTSTYNQARRVRRSLEKAGPPIP